MASKPGPPRPAPRLYVATPATYEPSSLIASLPGVLGACDVAAVLLRLKQADQRSMISQIKAVAAAVHASGAALLLDGTVELVARAGADGAHLSGIAAFEQALDSLKPGRIAGVGGLATRHDSMTAGELGADYVLFGERNVEGRRPSIAAIADRLQWWAELFEPPCVGYAATREEVSRFVEAGADFVLVDDLVWADPPRAASVLAELGKVMQEAYAACTTIASAVHD